jgi:hypothetical protein
MSENNVFGQMSPSPYAERQDQRIWGAAAVLGRLSGEETSRLIVARLARDAAHERGLPPCRQTEEPTSIFLDVIRFNNDESVAKKLRFGTQEALRNMALQPAPDPDVLGDLCYLAAAIGAFESIDTLTLIIKREDSEQLRIATGERIRQRALRALIGLLAVEPKRSPNLKELLQKLSADPQHRILALTGLVGLWPEEFHRHRSEVDEKELYRSLDLVGFLSSASAALARHQGL